MSSNTPTIRLRQRLVSFDGGQNFKPAFATSADELERHWPALVDAMEPGTRKQAERLISTPDRKTLLATYLSIAKSHLIVGVEATTAAAS